jgi:hypothetical protein
MNLVPGQGRKAKSRASTLQGGNDFTHVVANEAKASVFGVLFNDATKGKLRIVRHGIGFVENDELDTAVEELASTSKFFDFIANDLSRGRSV